MGQFFFEATDADGKRVAGKVDADDEATAITQLAAQAMTGIRLQPVVSARVRSPDTASSPVIEPLQARDFHEISVHVGNLLEAQVPLGGGLRAVAEELPPARLRRALLSLADQIDAGVDLGTAFESHRAPADLVAIVRAGLRTGQVGTVVQQYAGVIQAANSLKHRMRLVSAYPALLLLSGCAIYLFFFVVIIPQMKGVFAGFGVELPGITILYIGLSDFLVRHGVLTGAIVLIVLLAMWWVVRLTTEPAERQRFIHRIPLVGPLIKYAAWSRFFSLLAVFTEHSITFPESLRYAIEGTSDAELQRTGRLLAQEIAAGAPPASAAVRLRFPASFVHLLKQKEAAAQLPEALRLLATSYEHQARLQGAFVGKLASPLVIFCIGASVIVTVIAIFLPLIKLLNDLS